MVVTIGVCNVSLALGVWGTTNKHVFSTCISKT